MQKYYYLSLIIIFCFVYSYFAFLKLSLKKLLNFKIISLFYYLVKENL